LLTGSTEAQLKMKQTAVPRPPLHLVRLPVLLVWMIIPKRPLNPVSGTDKKTMRLNHTIWKLLYFSAPIASWQRVVGAMFIFILPFPVLAGDVFRYRQRIPQLVDGERPFYDPSPSGCFPCGGRRRPDEYQAPVWAS